MGSAFQGRVDLQCGKVVLEDFPLTDGEIANLRRVVILGSGTSHYASMVGRHLIERLTGLPADAESSSEFRYREPVLDRHTLVVSVGQSGETADTLSAMEEGERAGRTAVDHLQRGGQPGVANGGGYAGHASRTGNRRGQHQDLCGFHGAFGPAFVSISVRPTDLSQNEPDETC